MLIWTWNRCNHCLCTAWQEMSRACFQDGSMLLKMVVNVKMRSVPDVLLHGEADVQMICMWFSSHIHSSLCCFCCSCSGQWTTIPVFQLHGKLQRFFRSWYLCSFSSWDKKIIFFLAEYSMISGSGMGEWSALFPPELLGSSASPDAAFLSLCPLLCRGLSFRVH